MHPVELYKRLGVMSVPGPSVPGPSSQILDWVRVRVAVQELTVQELSGSQAIVLRFVRDL